MYNYFYGPQSEQFSFYRIPRHLFKDEAFKSLTIEEKLLYGLFLDRMNLSAKNKWVDEHGRVYIIFSVDEVMEEMACARQKASAMLGHLEKIGLIKRKRQGLGKPNLIFVKNFISVVDEEEVEDVKKDEEKDIQKFDNHTSRRKKQPKKADIEGKSANVEFDFQTSGDMNSDTKSAQDETKEETEDKSNLKKDDNQTSGSIKSELQEVLKSNGNYMNEKEIDYSNIDFPSFILSNEDTPFDLDSVKAIKAHYSEYFSYNQLLAQFPKNNQLVKEVINIFTDTLISTAKTFKVNGGPMDAKVVKERLLSLTSEHIEFTIQRLLENKNKVTNTKAYILTALYNSPNVIEYFYQALANDHLAWANLKGVFMSGTGGN